MTYFILTPAHIIILGKDRLVFMVGKGLMLCVWRGAGGLGWGTARNSLQILQVTTISQGRDSTQA